MTENTAYNPSDWRSKAAKKALRSDSELNPWELSERMEAREKWQRFRETKGVDALREMWRAQAAKHREAKRERARAMRAKQRAALRLLEQIETEGLESLL